MRKHLVRGSAVAAALVLFLLAFSNAATAYGLYARGDYQISGNVARVWVVNSSGSSRSANVTVVAQDTTGHYVQGSGKAFVPAHSQQPVTVYFSKSIVRVSRIIVTAAG